MNALSRHAEASSSRIPTPSASQRRCRLLPLERVQSGSNRPFPSDPDSRHPYQMRKSKTRQAESRVPGPRAGARIPGAGFAEAPRHAAYRIVWKPGGRRRRTGPRSGLTRAGDPFQLAGRDAAGRLPTCGSIAGRVLSRLRQGKPRQAKAGRRGARFRERRSSLPDPAINNGDAGLCARRADLIDRRTARI